MRARLLVASVLLSFSLSASAERGVSPNACTPTNISCNSTVTGTIDATDCLVTPGNTNADDWRFTGAVGQQVTIVMRSSAFDAYLILIGPSGTTIAENDDGAGGTDSRITMTLTAAGVHRIITGQFALGTGAYSMELTCSGGPTTPPPAQTLSFVVVTPCRQHDTRGASGPRIANGSTRAFKLTGAPCGIPEDAKAVSANITITNNETGFLSIWPVGGSQPVVSTLNYQAGGQYALANAALLPLGTNGAVNIFGQGATDVIIDVNGYFK